jgi:hypothetical protein
MATEVIKEVRESWKTPSVMGSIALVIFVFFGILGRQESVAFQLSGPRETIQLPNLDIGSSVLGSIAGVILLAISAYAVWRGRWLGWRGRSSRSRSSRIRPMRCIAWAWWIGMAIGVGSSRVVGCIAIGLPRRDLPKTIE